MGWLDGKVALVTGGGSGIGRAVVQRYIEEGARVAVLEKVADRLDQLKNDFGESVFPIQGDVTRWRTTSGPPTTRLGPSASWTSSWATLAWWTALCRWWTYPTSV